MLRVFHREFELTPTLAEPTQPRSISGYSGGPYTPELAKLLGAFKESGQLWLRGDLVQLAVTALTAATKGCQPAAATSLTTGPPQFDFVTYLGSSLKNYRKRGYNPALELLRGANRELKLPIVKTLRPRNSVEDQSLLSASGRVSNLRDSLLPTRPAFASWQRALLFDDVVTTGSTLLAATQALRALRVEVVAVATLADVELRRQVSQSK